MRPPELQPDDSSPQRALLTSRDELQSAVRLALRTAKKTVRVMHRDLSVFDLSSLENTEALLQLLLADRVAAVRLLVDDGDWLETRAARLRLLQRRFPHSLELRVASPADAVGDDAALLADDHAALELRAARIVSGSLWLHHRPHAQPLIAAFDRRWESGGHNLPVSPLGLA
jgi:hypothetical protein